jgi:putative endonuclease
MDLRIKSTIFPECWMLPTLARRLKISKAQAVLCIILVMPCVFITLILILQLKSLPMNGWMYILECADGSYYTGSTRDLIARLRQHMAGEGANHTKKRLPVKLVYFEEFDRIDEAYYREKQVQGWNRKKKEALVFSRKESLPDLSVAYRDREVASSTSVTVASRASATDGPMQDGD